MNYTVCGKTFEGETFMVFTIFGSTANVLYTSNSLLAIGIHYQKELLPRKSSHEHSFFILTVKVFPLECFAIYGILYCMLTTAVTLSQKVNYWTTPLPWYWPMENTVEDFCNNIHKSILKEFKQ